MTTAADFLLETNASSGNILRCRLLDMTEDGYARITHEGFEAPLTCEVLQGSDANAMRLSPGDSVLVWIGADRPERGVILGRVGTAREAVAPGGGLPDELQLEARKSLTIRCGEGSITLRSDGKILLRGQDLVSHARRLNRIKGAAVSIN